MVRPRGQGRGATSATTEDAETLLPASEPPAGARTRNAAPVAVAQGNSVGLFERIGDVADAMLPPPPRPRDPADRRRVWTWATVSFLLMCVMFGSVAGGPGGRRTRTREMALDGPSSPIGNQQRDVRSVATGPGLADDSKRANAESVAESPRDAYAPDVDDASYTSESNDAASGGAIPIPIPRTKGTCVTREARPSVRMAFRSDRSRGKRRPVARARGRARRRGFERHHRTRPGGRQHHRGVARDVLRRGPRRVRVGAGDFGAAPRRVLALAARDRRGHDGKRAVATQERGLSDTETTRSRWGVVAGVRGRVDRHERFEPFDLRAKIFARRRRGRERFFTKNKPSPRASPTTTSPSLFAEGVPKTVAGIIAVVEAIVELAPETKIVVLGITPRGERVGNTKVSYLQPSVWSAAIDATNARRRARFGKRETKRRKGKRRGGGRSAARGGTGTWCSSRARNRSSCGTPRRGGGKRVDERLMRDGLP